MNHFFLINVKVKDTWLIYALITFQGIIIHELLHVLGVSHEMQRPDRDNYIEINWSNLKVSYKKW